MKSKFASTALIIAVPVLFAVGFTILGSTFDYPEVLRKPSAEVLAEFQAKKAQILPGWWLMFIAALMFAPVSSLINSKLTTSQVTLTVGIAAAITQALGLSRWIFAVPVLAAKSDPSAVLIFDVLHQLLGVGIGEWAGYFFTSIWTALIANALSTRSKPLAQSGYFIAIGIALGLAETFGISIAGSINAIAYSVWILWMIIVAVHIHRYQPDHLPGAKISK